ncbi:Fanconi anemia group A protein-like, partial [Anneissia japonica]|uniref:Fanconi anemia group A protein-like n=1 Tax=Anneissia japonica TaxID=1529436 RepID=UPI001425A082
MKILTSLVPFEPSHIIKAHIQKSPHAIGKCQELVCDYILLGKTRLADLKEPLEPEGIFVQGQSSDGSKMKALQEQTESDIEQAIAAFEVTNQVPLSIIEA